MYSGPVSDAFRNERAFAVPSSSTAPVEGLVELTVIGMSATQAEISTPGEKHDYKFTASTAGKYTIETGGRTDLLMSLYGPDEQTRLIGKDDDSGKGLNPKIVIDLMAGTYYVRIQHYDGDRGTGAYSITVSM